MSTAAALGNSLEAIARFVDVSPHTLKRACRAELDHAREDLKLRMSVRLVQLAMSGHYGALRYWLGCFGGPEWKMSRDQDDAIDAVFAAKGEVVHFYMPPNGRDEPDDDDEPPTIDGVAA